MSENQVVSGVVKYVNGANAGGFYSIKVDTMEQPIGVGKYPPKCKVGDTVEFTYSNNARGYPNADFKSLKVVSSSQPQPAQARVSPAATPSAVAGVPMSKDDYWRNKETRDLVNEIRRDRERTVTQNEIRHQAARNAAIEFMRLLLTTTDSSGKPLLDIPQPTAKNRTKAHAAKLFLDKYTDEFYADTLAVNSKGQDAPSGDRAEDNEETDGE